MYNWNFPLLLLLCILNTIEADVRIVDGREYSYGRSLRSFHPDIRSFDDGDIRLRKSSPETTIREEYRDISVLQANRRGSGARTEQSSKSDRSLSRFKDNYERLSFRQGQAKRNHYFRLVTNRELSVNRLDDNERHSLHNLNNVRTGSDRQMHYTNERMQSLNELNRIKRENTQEVRRDSEDRIIRSSKDLRRLSRINREFKNTDSSKLLRNAYRAGLNRRDLHSINEVAISDEHRDRIAPFITSRQIERVISSRQDIQKDRSISRDKQRIIRTSRENTVVSREREIRNERSNRYELRINRARVLSSRSSERISFTNNRESRSMFALRRDTNLRDNERNIRENGNQRSSENIRGVFRSLQIMNIRDFTETAAVTEKLEKATRDACTRKATQRSIKINTDDSFSTPRENQRDSNNIRIVRREVRKIYHQDTRINKNQRSSIGDIQRNSFRYTTENDRIRNNIQRDAQINERNTELRRRMNSRLADRFKESSERLRGFIDRNSLRNNEDRTSEQLQQRTGYTHTIRRTRFNDRQMRSSNFRDNSDQGSRMRQNVNRNKDRRITTDNTANGRMNQIRRDNMESNVQKFENVKKNGVIREYVLNSDHSRNTMSSMGNEQDSLLSWQAAVYALQALYICSIVFKICNLTDSTKKRTRSFSWLSQTVNKID